MGAGSRAAADDDELDEPAELAELAGTVEVVEVDALSTLPLVEPSVLETERRVDDIFFVL